MDDHEADKFPSKMYDKKLWLKTVVDSLDLEVIPKRYVRSIIIDYPDITVVIDNEDIGRDLVVGDEDLLEYADPDLGKPRCFKVILDLEVLGRDATNMADRLLRRYV